MANKGITQLRIATALTGMEAVPLVQNGITSQATAQEIANLAADIGGNVDITNDITTAADLYPMFAAQTSGTATTAYVSSPNYSFNPATATLTAKYVHASNGIFTNANTITESYTIPTGSNGMSSGPITLSGATITVNGGSTWNVIGTPANPLAPWTLTGSPTRLTFDYNGTPVTSINNTGDLTAAGSVTAFGVV